MTERSRSGVGRRGAVGLAALIAATVACSVAETMPAPHCTSDSSSVLIMAQSVPSASLLACFDPLPAGWEVKTVDIGHDGTTVVFDSDRAGDSAARFSYEATCDIGEATPTPSDLAGTNRYEWIRSVAPRFDAMRFYRFAGGCVTWEFDFDEDAPSAMSVELGSTLQLVDRRQVNEDFRRDFVGEDL